jgi:hypothetical protein
MQESSKELYRKYYGNIGECKAYKCSTLGCEMNFGNMYWHHRSFYLDKTIHDCDMSKIYNFLKQKPFYAAKGENIPWCFYKAPASDIPEPALVNVTLI